MTQVSLQEAQSRLPDLIEAAVRGDDVVITHDPNRAVRLVPLPASKTTPRFGSAKGLIVMADDFDDPLEDFSEYMQ